MVQIFPAKTSIGSAIGQGLGQGIADIAKMGLSTKLNQMLQNKESQAQQHASQEKGLALEKLLGKPGTAPLFAALGDNAEKIIPYLTEDMLENLSSQANMPQDYNAPKAYQQAHRPDMNAPFVQNQFQEAGEGQQQNQFIPQPSPATPLANRALGQQQPQQQMPQGQGQEDRFITVNTAQGPKQFVKSLSKAQTPEEAADFIKRFVPIGKREATQKQWEATQRAKETVDLRKESNALQKEALEYKMGEKDWAFLGDAMKSADAADQVEQSLREMEKIRERGHIGPLSAAKGLLSADTRSDKAAYDTHASNVINLYKTMFPRGVTQVEFKRISEQWLPKSNDTSATNKAREDSFKQMVDLVKKRNQVMLSFQKPDGSFPKNLQALVDREMHSEEIGLKKKLKAGPEIDRGTEFEQLPAPNEFKKGDIVEDDQGNRFVSDGKSWKRVAK